MSKIVRLTESELVRLVKRIVKEEDDFEFEELDIPLEKEPSLFDDDNDIVDYGFDDEDTYGDDDDEFQNKMKFKSHMGKNKQSSIGIGAGTRWDKDSEKEWSPIKADDLPLDKFLKSKYNKM